MVGALLMSAACSSSRPAPSNASVAPPAPVASAAPVASVASPATTTALSPAAALPPPPVTGESISAAWVEQRLQRARDGHPEAVRLTVWKCWGGCTCPSPCLAMRVGDGTPADMGDEPSGDSDLDTSLWVDVLASHGRHLSLKDDASEQLTGHFTGRSRTVHQDGQTLVVYEIARDAVIRDVAKSGFGSTSQVAAAVVLVDGGS
jgi:hypothetical protein